VCGFTARLRRKRPNRREHLAGIAVGRIAAIADASGVDFLRLENLDVDLPPDRILSTQRATGAAPDNAYLPFVANDASANLQRRMSPGFLV
jgi:hypothetical protein